MKYIFAIVLSLVLPALVFAATNDFVANGNVIIPGVTFGVSTTNMLIMNGSTAESWSFTSGVLTVTNPGAAFTISSSDSEVKSIQITSGATTLACSENTTPGTSYATLPAASGTYTVLPSATTQCTSLCAVLPNVSTYNAFPMCGALSCSSGYQLSGSGANATCTAIPQGSSQVVGSGPSAPSAAGIPGYIKPRLQMVYPDGRVVYLDTTSSSVNPSVVSLKNGVIIPSAVFTKNLPIGSSSNDVRRLQVLFATDKDVYPEGKVTGYYGSLTKKAVERFQLKYGVVKSKKEAGYGSVGPKTRAKIREVFGL